MPSPRPGLLRRLRRCTGAAVLLAGLVGPGGGALAQDELALKAAIVFNLLQFVQWPGQADWPPAAPLRLCADRAGALWPQLSAVQGRPVQGTRVLELRDTPATAEALSECHAWLAEPGPGARRLNAAGAEGRPVLVIGDGERAEDAGVIVGLRRSGARLGFDVNLAAARRGGLQISSKLLRLAGKVSE